MKNISMLIGMILLLISIAINLINNKKKIISKSKKIKYYFQAKEKRIAVKCVICGSYLTAENNNCPVCNAPLKKHNITIESETENNEYAIYSHYDKILSVKDDELPEFIYQKYNNESEKNIEKGFVPKKYLYKKNIINIFFLIMLFISFLTLIYNDIVLMMFSVSFMLFLKTYSSKYNVYKYMSEVFNLNKKEDLCELVNKINSEMIYDNSKIVFIVGLLITFITSLIFFMLR